MKIAMLVILLLLMVHLAQGEINLAQGKPATQSTNYYAMAQLAENAVNGVFDDGNDFSYTAGEPNQWWHVDLAKNFFLSKVELYNREGYYSRLAKITIFTSILASPSLTVVDWSERSYQEEAYGAVGTILLNRQIPARHVRVHCKASEGLALQEVMVYEGRIFVAMETATHSSTNSANPASAAIDGDLTTYSTTSGSSDYWWKAVLTEKTFLKKAVVFVGNPQLTRVSYLTSQATTDVEPNTDGTGGWEHCFSNLDALGEEYELFCASDYTYTKEFGICSEQSFSLREIQIFGYELPQLNKDIELRTESATTTSVTLSFLQWNSDMIGEKPPTSYRVSVNGVLKLARHNSNIRRVSVTFTGLSAGTMYPVEVRCKISNDDCPGNKQTFTTQTTCTAPNVPVINKPSCTEQEESSRQRWKCIIAWQASTANCPGLVTYVIDGKVSKETTSRTIDIYVDGGEEYHIGMKAKNSDGVYSDRTDKYWNAAELAPQFGSSTFTVTEVNTNCVMLTWREPEFPGGTIQSYQYNCAKRGWITAAPDITETQSCGYEPNTQVYCSLVAKNSLNSTEILATGYTCPDLVATFDLSSVKTDRKSAIVVDLQDSTRRCHSIKQYIITVTAEDGSLLTQYSRETHGRFEISDLNGFTQYTVSVSAVNSANLFSSTSHTILTAETDVPEKPNQLGLQSNESCVDLRVTAPDVANGIITQYQFICEEEKEWFKHLGISEATSTKVFTSSACGFPSATRINCSAAALNSVGSGLQIFNFTFTQLQLKSPTDNYISIEENQKKGTTVEIIVMRATVENVDISFYYILVEQVQQNARTKRDTAQTCSTETVTKAHSGESVPPESCYVTANISAEELGERYVFNIGDDQTYGGFHNKPLEMGNDYNVYLALEAFVGDEKTSLMKLFPPSKFKFDPPKTREWTIVGAVIGALLIIAAGCVVVFCICRCRRTHKPPRDELELEDHLEDNKSGRSKKRGVDEDIQQEEDDLYDNSQGTGSEPVSVEKLGWFISTNQEAISAQYASLDKLPLPPMTAALSPENQKKCKCRNLCPADKYRVKLQRDDVHQTDFINSSYMKGYNRKIGYIASMGPFNEEISCDFWLMTWQQNPSAIVMVAKAEENTKMQCWQYWPLENGKFKMFGEISVTCRSTETYLDFSMSYLEVEKDGKKRVIPHFNYLTWPDYDVPDFEVFVAFHRLVKSTVQMAVEQPLIVHCSNGVGRSGTFIALDYLIEQAKAEGMVDMYTYVAEMRSRRPSMIQTLEQYFLLHQALCESLTTETFSCSLSKLQLKHSFHQKEMGEQTDTISVEYQHIFDRVNSLFEELPENQDRKMFTESPSCGKYGLLSTNKAGRSCIQATSINGHRTKGQWMAMQSPLSNTTRNFWELMLEQDVGIVIQLEETQKHFYPLKDKNNMFIDPFTITRKSSEDGEYVKTIDIMLQKDGVRPGDKQLKVLMAKNWTSESLPPTKLFIALQEVVEKLLHQTGSSKICVVCQDGSTRCGLYICVHNAIEKLKVEQQVNIYYSTVMAKLRRPQFIPTLEQYSYLYQVVNDYVGDLGEYSAIE